jgi:hypothetical protein
MENFKEIVGSAGIVIQLSPLRTKRVTEDSDNFYFGRISKDIISTLELFNKYSKDGYFVYDEEYEYDIMNLFKLDLRVDFHRENWMNWLSIIEKLNLITMGENIYPLKLLYTKSDIIELENIGK